VDRCFNEDTKVPEPEFARHRDLKQSQATEAFITLGNMQQVFGGLKTTKDCYMTLCNCDSALTNLDDLRENCITGIELHGPPYDWSGVPLGVGLLERDGFRQPSLLVFLVPQTTAMLSTTPP
jgi:hypothetical protein